MVSLHADAVRHCSSVVHRFSARFYWCPPHSLEFHLPYGLMLPTAPIRFPSAPDDASCSSSPIFSSNTHRHTPSNPVSRRHGAVVAIPLLIRRPTLLKPLNLRIQRSRGHLDHGGIHTEFPRQGLVAHRRKQNTQLRAFSPTWTCPSFFFPCVCVGDRFAVYTSWA